MQNVINVLTIILHFMELMKKFGMSKDEAAVATAGRFNLDISEVLEKIAKYLAKRK